MRASFRSNGEDEHHSTIGHVVRVLTRLGLQIVALMLAAFVIGCSIMLLALPTLSR